MAVAGFDSRYWGVVAFTRDREAVRKGLETITPFGSTALHDALDKAARDIASHGEGRRAVVVLTDGIDTSSQKTADEVIARSRALDVPIYAVSVVSPLDDPASPSFLGKKEAGEAAAATETLARYAELSGGAAFRVSNPAALRLAADRIAGELKHQYRLGWDAAHGPLPLPPRRGAVDPQGGHRAHPQRLRAAVVDVPRRPGRRSLPRPPRQGGHRVRTLIVPLLAASVALAGCAKKSYVQREVGEVNKKVDAVSAEVEKTQQRVQQNEVRIAAVDKSAQSGIGEAKGSAQAAMTKAQDAEKAAKGKLIYTVTLSNDKVRFPVNKAEISDEAKAMIDEAVGAARQGEPRRLLRDRGPHRQHRRRRLQLQAGRGAGHGGARLHREEARHRPQPAERHLLRRGQAGRRQQDPRRPRPEPPGRDPHPGVGVRGGGEAP